MRNKLKCRLRVTGVQVDGRRITGETPWFGTVDLPSDGFEDQVVPSTEAVAAHIAEDEPKSNVEEECLAMAGKFCVWSGKTEDGANRIAAHASKCGAIALFVRRTAEPTDEISLPVVYLSSGRMNTLSKLSSLTISLAPLHQNQKEPFNRTNLKVENAGSLSKGAESGSFDSYLPPDFSEGEDNGIEGPRIQEEEQPVLSRVPATDAPLASDHDVEVRLTTAGGVQVHQDHAGQRSYASVAASNETVLSPCDEQSHRDYMELDAISPGEAAGGLKELSQAQDAEDDKGSDSKLQVGKKRLPEVESSKSGQGVVKKIKGFVKSIMGPSNEEEIRSLLGSTGNWMEIQNAEHYERSVQVVVEASKNKSMHGITEEVMKMARENKESDLVRLAFAALVWKSSDQEDKCSLAVAILEWIERITPDKALQGALRRPRYRFFKAKPHLALGSFLRELMDNWPVELGCDSRCELFVHIFWLWNDYGLWDSAADLKKWKRIRQVVGKKFVSQHGIALASVLTPFRANSIGVLLQDSLSDLCGYVDFWSEALPEKKLPNLPNWIAQHIISLIQHVDVKKSTNDAVCSAWNMLFVALGTIQFERNKEAQRSISSTLAQQVSFTSRGTFQLYSLLLSSIGPDHPYHDALVCSLRTRLTGDLSIRTGKVWGTATPRMDDVTRLIQSSGASKLLASREGLDVISEFSLAVMRQGDLDFKNQLSFIGDLYYFFVLQEWTQQAVWFKDHLLRCIRTAVDHNTPAQSLREAFQLASEANDIFCSNDGSNAFVDDVSREIVLVSACQELIQCTSLFREVILGDSDLKGSRPFLNSLVGRTCEVLSDVCKDISQSSLLLEEVIRDEGSHSSPNAVSAAVHVFVNTFELWNPQTVYDLASTNPDSLRLFFSSLRTMADPTLKETTDPKLQNHWEERENVLRCSQQVGRTVERWLESYHSNNVTLTSLLLALGVCRNESWKLVEGFSENGLPSEDDLQVKIEQFSQHKASLKSNLSCLQSGTPSIRTLLQGYDCGLEEGTVLYKLFADYGWLFPEEHKSCTGYNRTEESANDAILLSVLERDSDAARAWKVENEEWVSVAYYFLSNQSLLFSHMLVPSEGQKLDLDSLSKAVKEAKSSMEYLFGSDCNYTDVMHAVDIIPSQDRCLYRETEVVLGCTQFDLTRGDIERFREIAMMPRVAKPLKQFVNCCEQFKFEVGSDSIFKKLSSVAEELDSDAARDWDSASCLDFSRRLRTLLLPTREYSCLQEECVALDTRLTALNILGQFSVHAEVWIFAREMRWLCEDGIKRFYAEYSNVTNVLLGNTESYEMSVLDSLEPTIKVASAIGNFVNEPQVAPLLDKIERVVAVNDRFSVDDLKQVQRNISLIREWFYNGVDEVAGVFSLFERVHSSGRYAISPETDEGESHRLVLSYQARRDSPTDCSLLAGEGLHDFVQHLGLIQHEKASVSGAIRGFIEQHQILSRAARNELNMFALGFEEIDLEMFECIVGEAHTQTAKQLLLRSKQRMQKFDAWLLGTRSAYKVSLLFWVEELRGVHRCLLNLANKPVGSCEAEDDCLHEIVRKSARVLPERGVGTDYMMRFGAAKAAAIPFLNEIKGGVASWLIAASKFLQTFHDTLGAPRHMEVVRDSSAEIVLHTISCDDDAKNEANLLLLQRIYKDRLPEEFEILDGSMACTLDLLNTFLQRVVAFSENTFVIMNIDSLDGKYLEGILYFLSDRENASRCLSLHCIQHGCSILHTSPWVTGQAWDHQSLFAQRNTRSWRGYILDKVHIVDVAVVTSHSSGSGKTTYIRRELRKLADAGSETNTITIHEGASISSLTAALASKFSITPGEKAIHVSFTYLPESLADNPSWWKCINNFFFSLLILRGVASKSSSFHLGEQRWSIYVEFPCLDSVKAGTEQTKGWLRQNLPVLSLCCRHKEPFDRFNIDGETRRVCTYLRAFDDGTINRKFDAAPHKRILFVLDRSGSMAVELDNLSSALSVATDNALRIFDSHIQIGDMFGVIAFDHRIFDTAPIQHVSCDNTKARLRLLLDQVRHSTDLGGTSMYGALRYALQSLNNAQQNMETWIVCLTDGASADSPGLVKNELSQTPDNLHLIVIGVNLHTRIRASMVQLCNKFRTDQDFQTKGFFIPASADYEGFATAFQVVASRIPVSQTFELDGRLTDEQCRFFLRKYIPESVPPHAMLLQNFWVRFLYRRVKVFDMNESFNYNETHESLGSSLMETMMMEVERFLDVKQNRDWVGENHAQLVYDFSRKDAPEFRLLCTSPEILDGELKGKYEALDLPGFFIPTALQLQERSTLDRFLSQALGVPLQLREDGDTRLKCIDDHGFILTLDFTMKLLSIHERVACGIPCIIEGETGVSKTALTKMYSILRNSSLETDATSLTERQLQDIEIKMTALGFSITSGSDLDCPQDRLIAMLGASSESVGSDIDFAQSLKKVILEECDSRPSLFQPVPTEYLEERADEVKNVSSLLSWFAESHLEQTFFELNVDASLSEQDIIVHFQAVREVARKLSGSDALVVVFLDEINTTSVMGLFKEIVVDRSICGESLEENVVVIAACNPPRTVATTKGGNTRENDLGKDWASGHYQVVELPQSLEELKWSFGSLNIDQERDFISRRLDALPKGTISPNQQNSMTELIAASHEAIREFALRNVSEGLMRSHGHVSESDAASRAKSVVSLRDIQRVFCLYNFFSNDFKVACGSGSVSQTHRNAVLLAIAMVYYLRLDSESRSEFLQVLDCLPTEANQNGTILDVLQHAMDAVLKETDIPDGIALTRGLKENAFMTLVCSLSRTPLMIVGPPGSSKTLSVNMISDNANGMESPSPFYRMLARLSFYHYQCSKQSTSKEIAAVFGKASQRQSRLDSTKQLCVVFMDEAGLPEEEKESLKVLHYLLEGHMSSKAEVGFVAITNHVLDAAKSNRCITLLRQEPDEEELLAIAQGVLFGLNAEGCCNAKSTLFDGNVLSSHDFSKKLCMSYSSLLHSKDILPCFDTFFGLRDFIYFLKAIGTTSTWADSRLSVSSEALVSAIERNFNGIGNKELAGIAQCFLEPLFESRQQLSKCLLRCFRHPMEVIEEALSSGTFSSDLSARPRFKLIIDCSEDDSILRLLDVAGVIDVSSNCMFKLSNLPEDIKLERLRLISGVKFAALQGSLAILSQTEPVNESFYDLFNQHFRVLTGRDGKLALYANIAVGGISRRSLVRPQFECIVHVRESELHQLPAPFLNRFEKFRLKIGDVLTAGWSKIGGMEVLILEARKRVFDLVTLLGKRAIFGWVDGGQTIDSIFVDMLPASALNGLGPSNAKTILEDKFSLMRGSFASHVTQFLSFVTSLQLKPHEVGSVMELALKYLPIEDADILRQLSDKGQNIDESYLKEALLSIVRNDKEKSSVARACEKLIQMIIARVASSRLVQLATPEAIFARRGLLPHSLLNEYFQQEHFSLKALVARITSAARADGRTQMALVYTRTDAFIHSIPTFSANQSASPGDSRVETIRSLVHENVNKLIIQNMSMLTSEVLVRSAVRDWICIGSKDVLVVVADMSSRCSTDHINFVRLYVEQSVAGISGKSFILLLHYPPSTAYRSTCYPALFLGGWHHVFLDGVGHTGPTLELHTWIEAACQASSSCEPYLEVKDVSNSLAALVPRVLTHVASQNIFYPEQVQGWSTRQSSGTQPSFTARYKALLALFDIRLVGNQTVGSILCNKFSSMWSKRTLVKTLRRASRGLRLGTTQLSISMSMYSMLLETFGAFITSAITEMNQWRNLDILMCSQRCVSTDELFFLILEGLPVTPLEEIVLHRNRNRSVQALPHSASAHEPSSVYFPFFFFVSFFLDQLIEQAEEHLAKSALDEFDPGSIEKPSCADLLSCTMKNLCSGEDAGEMEKVGTSRQKKIVLDTIKFVAETRETDDPLFGRYLRHFIVWKLGCELNSVVLGWLRKKVESECQGYDNKCFEDNILLLHVIARRFDMEMLRVSSWSSSISRLSLFDATPSVDFSAAAEFQGGMEIVVSLLDHFEENLISERSDDHCWHSSFSFFFQQIPSILFGIAIDDDSAALRLRLLCFFNVLDRLAAPQAMYNKALRLWYDSSKCKLRCNNIETSSLETLLNLVDGKNLSGHSRCDVLLFRYFFSPLWIKTTTSFIEQDLSFLLDCVAKELFNGKYHQLAVTLLRSASAQRPTQIGSNKDDCRLNHYYRNLPLQMINSRIQCNQISVFSEDGQRTRVPHYIPSWLHSEYFPDNADRVPASNNPAIPPAYFSNYQHCFDGPLAKITFDMILGDLAPLAESLSSEELLKLLLRDMETETRLVRHDEARMSRLRSAGQCDTFVGSAIAAITVSARLVCFVAKVAYELATRPSMDALALNGVYREAGLAMIDTVMSLDCARWRDFFFATIMRVRGEGTLTAVLSSENCPLRTLSWWRLWASGMPSLREGTERRLQEAEHELAEALREEERKVQEFRLCPHCHRPFAVYARNCGTFECGRDAHTQNVLYGCGNTFSLDNAPPYSRDERILAPLRQRVTEENARLKEGEQGARFWEGARGMNVPVLSFRVVREIRDKPLLPSSFAVGEVEGAADQVEFIKVLLDGAKFANQFSLLPDLVELYLWIHSTFRYLVTRHKAFSLRMKDIMNEERLLKRFSEVRVGHLLSLWERIMSSMGSVLDSMDHKVLWECDEIELPFETVEEAFLISFLSEGDHPTDGNDYLFLIINNIVRRYNAFARRVETVSKTGSLHRESFDKDRSIHPKFLVRGNGGAVTMEAFAIVSQTNLKELVESCWDSEINAYNAKMLDQVLREESMVHKEPPVILNPTQFLRCKFNFRDDSSPGLEKLDSSVSILRSSQGDYFAQAQDIHLFEEVQHSLLAFGLNDDDDTIQKSLASNFHSLNYHQLRSMLEGVRSSLELLSTEKVTEFASLEAALFKAMRISSGADQALMLESVGFPELSAAQVYLILSLRPNQIVELVTYLGYQLASEAHLFCNLPLCMTESLTPGNIQHINEAFKSLSKEDGAVVVVNFLDDFVRDVLIYYEGLIRDEALSSNKTLKTFLSDNNFCDNSDPVFLHLPSDITIRNYIPLRQVLHQLKLSLLLQEQHGTKGDDDDEFGEVDNGFGAFVNPSRGRCWLWESVNTENGDIADVEPSVHVDSQDLWFEVSLEREVPLEAGKSATAGRPEDPHAIQQDMPMDLSSKGASSSEDFEFVDTQQPLEIQAAKLIQRWWRSLPRTDSMEIDDFDAEWQNMMELDDYKEESGPLRNDSATTVEKPELFSHGSSEDELVMRKWIDSCNLPQSAADEFVKLGARNLDEVFQVLEHHSELLENLAPFDRIKLEAAMRDNGRE